MSNHIEDKLMRKGGIELVSYDYHRYVHGKHVDGGDDKLYIDRDNKCRFLNSGREGSTWKILLSLSKGEV